jgi:hypothetical protein
MTGRLKTNPATRRDRLDAARLKRAGDPAHINPAEDRLLRRELPESHGAVVTRGLLADAGRLGDDRVTQINTREAALLRARGGSGSVNPATGLLEYYGDDDGGMSGGVGDDSGGTSQGGGHSDGDNFGGGDGGGMSLGYRAYDPTRTRVESLLAAPNFAPPGMSFTQYAPRDTWARAFQEYMTPHPAAMRATPGRLGAPNAHGPGIMGSFVSQLAGGPFSAMMGVGGALSRASSKETQEASAREDAARSGHNSNGQQQSHSVLEMDAKLAEAAGTRSGAETSQAAAPPGYTVNAAGQIVPLPGGERERGGLSRPVENLLADYIWRGRQGSALGGFGW